MRNSWVTIIFVVVILAVTMYSCVPRPMAHDFYANIRNPVSGEGCCGGKDCQWIDTNKHDLVETETEFILDKQWHFPKSEAMPSPDGGYHACIWGGKPRCFFYPTNT